MKSLITTDEAGTSLAVQWLGLCTSTTGGPGFNSRSRSWDPTSCVVRPKDTNTADKLMRLWLVGVTPSREGKLALSAKMTNTSEAATAGGAHTGRPRTLSHGMQEWFLSATVKDLNTHLRDVALHRRILSSVNTGAPIRWLSVLRQETNPQDGLSRKSRCRTGYSSGCQVQNQTQGGGLRHSCPWGGGARTGFDHSLGNKSWGGKVSALFPRQTL